MAKSYAQFSIRTKRKSILKGEGERYSNSVRKGKKRQEEVNFKKEKGNEIASSRDAPFRKERRKREQKEVNFDRRRERKERRGGGSISSGEVKFNP